MTHFFPSSWLLQSGTPLWIHWRDLAAPAVPCTCPTRKLRLLHIFIINCWQIVLDSTFHDNNSIAVLEEVNTMRDKHSSSAFEHSGGACCKIFNFKVLKNQILTNDILEDVLADMGINSGQRVIEEDQTVSRIDRPCHWYSLLLTAREIDALKCKKTPQYSLSCQELPSIIIVK